MIGLREENKRLAGEYDCLLKDFEECKAQLRKWQAPVQTSDDSIQKDLEKLHLAIDGWVYDAVADVKDDLLYERCLLEHRKLQRQQRRTKFEDFIKTSAVNTWGPYSCSNFFILSLIIQWILDELVFREQYPHAVTPSHVRALRDIEEAMRTCSQPRG